MPIPVTNPNHKQEARDLLTDQFKNRTVTVGILDSVSDQVQLLETAVFDVIEKRKLDDATFAQLDSLGDLVGEARQGRTDDAYREAIRLRIRVNRANGKAEDVIVVTSLATHGHEFDYREIFPAGFEVELLDIPAPQSLATLIKASRAAGSKGVLISSDWDAFDTFILDYDGGGVATPGAFSYTEDSSGYLLTWAIDA